MGSGGISNLYSYDNWVCLFICSVRKRTGQGLITWPATALLVDSAAPEMHNNNLTVNPLDWNSELNGQNPFQGSCNRDRKKLLQIKSQFYHHTIIRKMAAFAS